jgi:hypothetical protein
MYGVPPRTIARESALGDPDRLQVGEVLTIPRLSGALHRVAPGETVEQIAARAGVPLQEVLAVNMLDAASVTPGLVLLLPDAAALPHGK